jgi:hypothetical protein
MRRRTKWIFWILVLSAFVALKAIVSPTDAELYERLERQTENDAAQAK